MAIAELEQPIAIHPTTTIDYQEVTQVNGIIDPETQDPATMALITEAKERRAKRAIMSPEGWFKRQKDMRQAKVDVVEAYKARRVAEDLLAGRKR